MYDLSMCVCVFSHSLMSESLTPRTVAYQAPLSMGFSWQEYSSVHEMLLARILEWVAISPSGCLPKPGI